MQLPVLAVEGDAPSWWLWDSHVASPIEARSSSWSFLHPYLHAGQKAWKLGALITEL